MTGPLALALLAATLGDATVAVSWTPAPGALGYRVYVCQAPEAVCWGLDFARRWVLLGEFPEPRVSGPRPDRPTWLAVSNVYPDREIVRVGEVIYLRPGSRFMELPVR